MKKDILEYAAEHQEDTNRFQARGLLDSTLHDFMKWSYDQMGDVHVKNIDNEQNDTAIENMVERYIDSTDALAEFNNGIELMLYRFRAM